LAWTVEFTPGAERDLKQLDRPVQQRIIRFMRERVASAEDPRAIGEVLRGQLAGLWRPNTLPHRGQSDCRDRRRDRASFFVYRD